MASISEFWKSEYEGWYRTRDYEYHKEDNLNQVSILRKDICLGN